MTDTVRFNNRALCTAHQGRFNALMHHTLLAEGWRGEEFVPWLDKQPMWRVENLLKFRRVVLNRLYENGPCEACDMLTLVVIGGRP